MSGGAELVWKEVPSRDDGDLQRRTFTTHIPSNYSFFEGHFRGYPVLAGVVQLHELVLPCVRRVRPELGDVARMGGLKFPSRIAPDESLAITLSWHAEAPKVTFEIARGDERCTLGWLAFAPSEVDGDGR